VPGGLADTLEDRGIRIMLQRKAPGAKVERLRRRDNEWFAALRNQAARWATDNFDKLADPDPKVPEALNDRAADNWRPLLAIADLAGGDWPTKAREAACLLSGEAHSDVIRIELLKDIQGAFGDDDVIRSADLIAKLVADPERPWADWKHGRCLTQKQLAGLLKPFFIISDRVRPTGLPQGKGYRRSDFEEAWSAYCPGQPPLRSRFPTFDPYIRTNARGIGTSKRFCIRTRTLSVRIEKWQLVPQPCGFVRLYGSKPPRWR
jgi:Protein of unknown function (DUF3631)